MVRDIPLAQTPTKPSFDAYRALLANQDVFNRDLMFVALEGDRIVGYSGFRRPKSNPGHLETRLTGVARTHRRRGIATALKSHALLSARDRGFRTVQTDNLAHNPMYEINRRLGFRTAWTWLHYLKEL